MARQQLKWLFTVSLHLLLQLQPQFALKHETIVLSKNLSGSFHRLIIDGATVMSERFYKDHDLTQSVILQPTMPSYRLLLQFIYFDLEEADPCRDQLTICETPAGFSQSHNCIMPMVTEACGSIRNVFGKSSRRHSLSTSQAGRNLLIVWKTQRPSATNRGFKIIVTAFSDYGDCKQRGRWQCSNKLCISSDLHCDNIAHCLDNTDEIVNCSNSNHMLPGVYPCDSGEVACISDEWNEEWFGIAIPMICVFIIFLVALIYKIRNVSCQGNLGPRIGLRRSSSSQQNSECQLPRCPSPITSLNGVTTLPGHCGDLNVIIATAPPREDYESILGGRSVAYDPVSQMLLPPPYSPPDDTLPYQYPLEGENEPPPRYQQFLHNCNDVQIDAKDFAHDEARHNC